MSRPASSHEEALRQVTEILMRLQRPRRLLRIISRFIDREFDLSHTSILIFEQSKNHYSFVHSKGLNRIPVGLIKIDPGHPLITCFERKGLRSRSKRDYVYLSELKDSSDSPQEEKELRAAMQAFRAVLVIPAYDRKELIALMMLGEKKSQELYKRPDITFFQTLAHTCSMAIKAAQYHENLELKNRELQKQLFEIEHLRKKERETYKQILKSLVQEVHAKDPYTYGHINQVERLGMMTAQEMGLPLEERKHEILSAALILHDVGKIGIPDHILQKPAKLDPEEWRVMQTHVEKGYRILEPIDLFKEVAEIVYCHHERFDGAGYPRGLKGDEIPVGSKIISVVDAYHAIVSKRCYDAARPVEEAFRELEKGAGTQFDPEVVHAFIRAQKREMNRRGVTSYDIHDTESDMKSA